MQINHHTTVLVAVSNEILRVGFTHSLHGGNIVVIGEASTESDAIDQAERLQPNVVLLKMDYNKAELSRLAAAIGHKSPNTHILLVDFHCTKEEIFEFFPARVHGYCLLNTEIPKLQAAIQSIAEAVLWVGPGVIETPEVLATRPVICSSALSERETEVLRLLTKGMSNRQIASALSLSVETIKSHMRHILEKPGVTDRTQAALKALKNGLHEAEARTVSS